MGEAERIQVLQRKARTGREEHQARVMSPPRALRLALARVAEDLFGLNLSVSSIRAEEANQAGVMAAFTDEVLTMVLDGPDGALGAVSVEMPILAGLIEMQTMGSVLDRAPDARPPTQTDAALVAPLLDAVMSEFAESLTAEAAQDWARGYRFGAMVDGPRMLGLMLDAPDFHLFHLQVDLGDGAKRGEIVMALPQRRGAVPDPVAGDENSVAPGGLHLEQGALMAAEATMKAVLDRIRMPLSQVSKLKVGDVLHVQRAALGATRLESGDGRGGLKCRLGQINGFRAVRMGAAGHKPDAGDRSDTGEAGQTMRLAEMEGDDNGALIDMPGRMETVEDMPDLSDLSGMGSSGGPSGGADPSDFPELQNLETGAGDGAMSGQEGLANFGDLTDLDDLPDLADMADLPDMSDLSDIAMTE